MELTFGEHTFTPLPERALWWEATRSLILSDVHLGKTATFRAKGLPLPEGETLQDLQRMSQLVGKHGATRLLIVGDLFHALQSLSPVVVDAFSSWLNELDAEVTLILGNHDQSARLKDRFPTMDRSPSITVEGVDFVHDPDHATSMCPTICGHKHPVIELGNRRRRGRLRLPVFVKRRHILLLPAFGTFTGGHPLHPEKGDEIVAIADDTVQHIPAAMLAR